jgi:hypothetical protein
MMRAMMAVSIALGLVAVAFGQGQQRPGQPPQAPVFRGDTERVRIDAIVSDRGHPVTGLRADDFEIKDNGTVVPALEMATTTGAVSVAVALDVSAGARRDKWDEIVGTCEGLLGALQPRDSAWFVTFANDIRLRVGPVRAGFAIARALETLDRGAGQSMWDALFGSISLASGQPGRSLVVLISAGVPDFSPGTSYLDERRALEVLKRSDVAVAAVRPHNVPTGYGSIEEVVRTTGGDFVDAKQGDEGRKVFADLINEFRLGYVLTYRPTGLAEPKDGWHEIEVRLKKKSGQVRARRGYYSPGK